MSTTLGKVIEWAKPFIGDYFLLTDSTLEPALSNANNLIGTILSPPFTWEWNRSYTDFFCTAGVVDYPRELPDFGFIESATIQNVFSTDPPGPISNIIASVGPIYQLTLKRFIERSFQPGRPSFLSVVNDDLNGNITFRVGMSAPDPQDYYQVEITYQKAFVPLTSLKSNLVIPDKLAHIFQYGFLAMAYFYNQDSRFAEMNQKFVATLLSVQQGLDENERNMFLSNWYALLADQSAIGLKVNQGKQARGAE